MSTLTTSSIASIITKFSGTIPNWNWKVKDGTLAGQSGSTSQVFDRVSRSVTTTFNSQSWKDASDLSWARTILHESIHAYLLVYFRTEPLIANQTYSQLVTEYGNSSALGANAIQHNEFVRSFVGDIGIALQEFGMKRGYNLPIQFYQDMAWGGLQNTQAFLSLPQIDRVRISDVLSIEISGIDMQGNTIPQKGTKPGC